MGNSSSSDNKGQHKANNNNNGDNRTKFLEKKLKDAVKSENIYIKNMAEEKLERTNLKHLEKRVFPADPDRNEEMEVELIVRIDPDTSPTIVIPSLRIGRKEIHFTEDGLVDVSQWSQHKRGKTVYSNLVLSKKDSYDGRVLRIGQVIYSEDMREKVCQLISYCNGNAHYSPANTLTFIDNICDAIDAKPIRNPLRNYIKHMQKLKPEDYQEDKKGQKIIPRLFINKDGELITYTTCDDYSKKLDASFYSHEDLDVFTNHKDGPLDDLASIYGNGAVDLLEGFCNGYVNNGEHGLSTMYHNNNAMTHGGKELLEVLTEKIYLQTYLSEWGSGILRLPNRSNLNGSMRILAINGNGMGISVLRMLTQLEEQSKHPCSSIFDMIGGSGTGAIIAFLLVYKRMKASKILQLFVQVEAEVAGGYENCFSEEWDQRPNFEVLKSLVEEVTDMPLDAVSYPHVFALSSKDGKPYLSSNFEYAGNGDFECNNKDWLKEALLDSIQNESVANSPTAMALRLLADPSFNKEKRNVDFVLSLGTRGLEVDKRDEAHNSEIKAELKNLKKKNLQAKDWHYLNVTEEKMASMSKLNADETLDALKQVTVQKIQHNLDLWRDILGLIGGDQDELIGSAYKKAVSQSSHAVIKKQLDGGRQDNSDEDNHNYNIATDENGNTIDDDGEIMINGRRLPDIIEEGDEQEKRAEQARYSPNYAAQNEVLNNNNEEVAEFKNKQKHEKLIITHIEDCKNAMSTIKEAILETYQTPNGLEEQEDFFVDRITQEIPTVPVTINNVLYDLATVYDIDTHTMLLEKDHNRQAITINDIQPAPKVIMQLINSVVDAINRQATEVTPKEDESEEERENEDRSFLMNQHG